MKGWLAGKLMVVTGASQGVGAATAIALASRGAHVIAVARNKDNLDSVVARIRDRGGTGTAIAFDLREAGSVPDLFSMVDKIGELGGLVCCAAMFQRASVDATDVELWRSLMSVNLDSVWMCSREAYMRIKDRESGGRILNISSLSGVYGAEKFPGLAAYNTSKCGVIGLTEAVAVEGREHGISAVCVSPGAVDTDMLRLANPNMKARLSAEDLGDLIADLLDGPQFEALSGTNIPLFSNA